MVTSKADTPLRVALVRRGYSPSGGAEAFLLRFAAALCEAGHEPSLVSDRAWPRTAWSHGPLHVLPGRTPMQFARAVEEERPRLAVDRVFSFERLLAADCYRAGDGVHAAWLDRRARREPRWRDRWRRLLGKHRQLLRLEACCFDPGRTAAVIVNSRMVGDEIAVYYDYPREQMHLVRNGIEARFAARLPQRGEARTRLGVPEEDFVAAFVGSGWERKGLEFAVRAVETCGAPHSRLIVAGRGSPRGHASPRVRFLGAVTDVGPVLAAADVFVLPTLYDPFSNACLEALAAGLPVITTRANGCAEILTEGVTGSVVETPDDVPALSRALEFWAGADRRAAARSACAALAAEYTIERNVTETLRVLVGA